MNLSNVIAHMISEMLEEKDEIEIQRNVLAQNLGCVPSQINYVLSSRFTPERGYIVESRRGGGGFIRIARINYDSGTLLMHVVNSVGSQIDEKSCKSHLINLVYSKLIDEHDAKLILAATSDNSLRALQHEQRDTVRAAIFKQLLLTLMQ